MLRNPFLSLIFLCFMFSCTSNSAQGNKNTKSVEQILSKLDSRDTIPLLDLSYKNIKELPDLSRFKVRKLNISHNNLDTLVLKNLPTYLVDLDASHNKIKNTFNFVYAVERFGFKLKDNISKYIKQINLSNNEIEGISFLLYKTEIKRIVLSNNNLDNVTLFMNGKKLNYLDVTNNPKLSNIGTIDLVRIDTLKSNSIAIDAPFKFIEPPKITTVPDKN